VFINNKVFITTMFNTISQLVHESLSTVKYCDCKNIELIIRAFSQTNVLSYKQHPMFSLLVYDCTIDEEELLSLHFIFYAGKFIKIHPFKQQKLDKQNNQVGIYNNGIFSEIELNNDHIYIDYTSRCDHTVGTGIVEHAFESCITEEEFFDLIQTNVNNFKHKSNLQLFHCVGFIIYGKRLSTFHEFSSDTIMKIATMFVSSCKSYIKHHLV